MPVPLAIVDAFTDRPFAGNPAAVCLLESAADAGWMQRVAAEMNLSETAFLVPRDGGFGLRWFTPAVEVDLCGHATLASAHVLWESGRLALAVPARFHSKSGLLTAERDGGRIVLDFPAKPCNPADAPPGLLDGLGTTATFVGFNGMDYFVELASADEVRRLRPDHARLRTLPVRGVIVTAKSDDARSDFVSRFFAPGSGIDEDPVTGSAHCCLAPYWADKIGKSAMVGFQASARGGVVAVEVRGERVRLGGTAVTVVRGELTA
jgi:PhzF family phenazine biosynthesis protein